MGIDLLRDLDRADAWLLTVDASEQSYVDLEDPFHLEFEYVQHIAHVVDTWRSPDRPLDALHLGGGLCTVPRWLAARSPGSKQDVIEASEEIAALCRSLTLPAGVDLRVGDARDWFGEPPAVPSRQQFDLCVVDLYAGPETVADVFAAPSLAHLASHLRSGGLLVANLSDAMPFDLGRAAAAGLRMLWPAVAVVAEPPVMRGRRSGNLVLAATASLDIRALTRRCAAGLIRGRVLADAALTDWIGDAVAAASVADLPASGEVGSPTFR